ncbi:MAG: phenylacetate--CoA ligase family protein [Planctomycetota bacterium]
MTETSYHRTTEKERRELENLSRPDLEAIQFQKLETLLQIILPDNPFYASKFNGVERPIRSMQELEMIEQTIKAELIDNSDSAGFARNLTYPIDSYSRFHRTSGTSGRPLIVLDTPADWVWWKEAWQFVLDHAGITHQDRVVMAFSFGPFIGFWSAFDAVAERESLVVPTGAMGTQARVELIRNVQATTIFCTPSYALHMSEVMRQNEIDPNDLAVDKIVVAGEPGGSIPEIRERIEDAWNAKVIDHAGASEVGPWGIADQRQRGIYINESEFIAEFQSVETGLRANEGELSELILTCLGRSGSPVIRYKTGDLVRPRWQLNQECQFVMLEGGVLGRTDDMMIIRGVNVFPSSIEAILRRFPEILEYRITAYRESSMDQLKIEVEDELGQPERIKSELAMQLGFRVEVETVPIHSLPRFELKGKRFIDQR